MPPGYLADAQNYSAASARSDRRHVRYYGARSFRSSRVKTHMPQSAPADTAPTKPHGCVIGHSSSSPSSLPLTLRPSLVAQLAVRPFARSDFGPDRFATWHHHDAQCDSPHRSYSVSLPFSWLTPIPTTSFHQLPAYSRTPPRIPAPSDDRGVVPTLTRRSSLCTARAFACRARVRRSPPAPHHYHTVAHTLSPTRRTGAKVGRVSFDEAF